MSAYYNEIEPFAAEWLKNLIAAGLIAPGDVDTRSIKDVKPDDLRGYDQCHFFAGIGLWSLALRTAGWPDKRPVWTGSCPCQPFSAAGRGKGAADERHLFPHWFHLVEQCTPPVVFGEQVASKDGLGWLDLVQADLEGAGYAVAAADMCAAGIGAPHIRQRLWFVAERLDHSAGARHVGPLCGTEGDPRDEARMCLPREGRADGRLAHPDDAGPQERRSGPDELAGSEGREAAERSAGLCELDGGMADAGRATDERVCRSWPTPAAPGTLEAQQREWGGASDWSGRASGRVAQPGGEGRIEERSDPGGRGEGSGAPGLDERFVHGGALRGMADSSGQRRNRLDALLREEASGRESPGVPETAGGGEPSGLVNDGWPRQDHNVWRDADWLFCRDGKWRPVEPAAQQMADGYSSGMGSVRPDVIAEIEREASDAALSEADVREALRDLWRAYAEEAVQWPAGRPLGLQEAPVLLTFMRELAREGWRLLDHLPPACWQSAEDGLRELRGGASEAARSPQGSRPVQQLREQPADALSVVSQAIAHAVGRCWTMPGPLAVGAPTRVGRLRAYGNAIVPQVAATFIEAYLGASRVGF